MTWKQWAYVAVFAMAAVGCVALSIWANGGTFWQKCAAMFPADTLKQERCVWDLDHGQRP